MSLKSRLKHSCKHCGKVFFDYASNNRSYCSKQCFFKKIESNTYATVHVRLRRKYGLAPLCIWDETHQRESGIRTYYQWANVTGNYTDDIQDYLPMCLSCHKRFDLTDEFRKKVSGWRRGVANHNGGPVHQYSKRGKLLKTWPYAALAARECGINYNSIKNNLGHSSLSAGGFVWRRET